MATKPYKDGREDGTKKMLCAREDQVCKDPEAPDMEGLQLKL